MCETCERFCENVIPAWCLCKMTHPKMVHCDAHNTRHGCSGLHCPVLHAVHGMTRATLKYMQPIIFPVQRAMPMGMYTGMRHQTTELGVHVPVRHALNKMCTPCVHHMGWHGNGASSGVTGCKALGACALQCHVHAGMRFMSKITQGSGSRQHSLHGTPSNAHMA